MLSKSTLEQSLRPLFDPPTMPREDVVGAWCRAIIPYAQAAIAGPVALVAPLSPVSLNGDFLSSLDVALRTMWTSAVWAGPAVTAVTTLVPPVAPFVMASAPVLIVNSDPELGRKLIAEAIHTYTLSIVVTVTPATGTPFAVPLT